MYNNLKFVNLFIMFAITIKVAGEHLMKRDQYLNFDTVIA